MGRKRIEPTIGGRRRSRRYDEDEIYHAEDDYNGDRYLRVRNLETSQKNKRLIVKGYIYLFLGMVLIFFVPIAGLILSKEYPWFKEHSMLTAVPGLVFIIPGVLNLVKAAYDDWMDRG